MMKLLQMNFKKVYLLMFSCVLSHWLGAQETYEWVRIDADTGNYYEMHRIDFLNAISLGVEFTIPESDFEHENMTGLSVTIFSFEYTDDRSQVYFIEEEGDLFRYTVATGMLEYIRDLTPETTPFPLVFGYTAMADIFFINDSILYCGGLTHGYYNINTDTFQKLREPANNTIAASEYEQEILLSRATYHKGNYIYSAGGVSNSIRKLTIGDPEANTELLDFDQFNIAIWLQPIISYRDACGKTTLYQGGRVLNTPNIEFKYWKVDIDNGTIEYSHPYENTAAKAKFWYGNVKHYNATDWEDCQRVIDLDADDSSIGGVDYLMDSLCGYAKTPMSDIDIRITNEYAIDSVVIALASPASAVYFDIPDGNYTLISGANKVTIENTGTSVLEDFEKAIRDGYVVNPDRVAELRLSFTVWYDGASGSPAIATYRYAGRIPEAGDDMERTYCEQEAPILLENILAPNSESGGIFYNNRYEAITSLPDYEAPVKDTIHYVTTNGACYDTATLAIVINPRPVIEGVPDYILCFGEEQGIDLTAIDGSVEWWDGNQDKERTFDRSGTYTYDVQNAFGCTTSDTFHLTYLASPEITPIATKVCKGEEFTFMGKVYTEPGMYRDTLMDRAGCDSVIYDIELEYYEEQPIEIKGDLGFCAGESTTLEVVSNHPTLTLNGDSTGHTIIIDDAGIFTIGAYDKNGCYQETEMTVVSYELPAVMTENMIDTVYTTGMRLKVEYVGENLSYRWKPSSSLSCDDCPYPNLVEGSPGIYTIEIVDANGCMATGEIVVSFKETEVYLPTVIANRPTIPENGTLYLKGNTNGMYDLSVYDRWGNLLYHGKDLTTNNPDEGWQPAGRYNPGVYVYKIIYKKEGVEQVITGDITLL